MKAPFKRKAKNRLGCCSFAGFSRCPARGSERRYAPGEAVPWDVGAPGQGVGGMVWGFVGLFFCFFLFFFLGGVLFGVLFLEVLLKQKLQKL